MPVAEGKVLGGEERCSSMNGCCIPHRMVLAGWAATAVRGEGRSARFIEAHLARGGSPPALLPLQVSRFVLD